MGRKRSKSGKSSSSKKVRSTSSKQMRRNRSSHQGSCQNVGIYADNHAALDLTNMKDSSQPKLSRASSNGRQMNDGVTKIIQNSTISQPFISSSTGEILRQQNGPSQLEMYQNNGGSEEGQSKKKLEKQSSLKKIETRSQPMSYTKVFVMGDTRHG